MAHDIDKLMDKITSAQATRGGNWIRDGKYRFALERLEMHEGEDNTSFVIELRVKSSQKVRDDVEPNAVGSRCSSVYNLTKHKSAPGNTKAFMLAALAGLGIPESAFSAKWIKEATSDLQPLRGLLIDDETYRKAIKSGDNKGKEITLHNWITVAQTPAQLAASRAELDSTADVPDPNSENGPAASAEPSMAATLAGLGIK